MRAWLTFIPRSSPMHGGNPVPKREIPAERCESRRGKERKPMRSFLPLEYLSYTAWPKEKAPDNPGSKPTISRSLAVERPSPSAAGGLLGPGRRTRLPQLSGYSPGRLPCVPWTGLLRFPRPNVGDFSAESTGRKNSVDHEKACSLFRG